MKLLKLTPFVALVLAMAFTFAFSDDPENDEPGRGHTSSTTTTTTTTPTTTTPTTTTPCPHHEHHHGHHHPTPSPSPTSTSRAPPPRPTQGSGQGGLTGPDGGQEGVTNGDINATPPPNEQTHWLEVYEQPLFLGRRVNYSHPQPGIIIPEFPVKSYRFGSTPDDGFCETICLDRLQIAYNCTDHVGSNLTANPANKILIWDTTNRLFCETSKMTPINLPISGSEFEDSVVTQD